jgi:osmotically-inducible protein OsmY
MAVMTMTDKEIQKAVLEELEWEPEVKSTEIGVAVNDGVVTLTGFVDSYAKKYSSERAAKRVHGVRAVVNDLVVKLPGEDERPDPEIAHSVVQALKWRLLIPVDQIKVTVRDGWVTLEGDVDWQFQREWAESAARHVKGVKGIFNLIMVNAKVEPKDVKERIEEALRRTAEVDANRITVETEGSTVILRGTVRSWTESEEAERAAWRAPGVTKVENHIIVGL